jgi:hypothetical protein
MDAFQKEIDQLTGTDFFQLAKRESGRLHEKFIDK